MVTFNPTMSWCFSSWYAGNVHELSSKLLLLAKVVVLRLGKARLLLPVSGKVPERKWHYYFVTKDLNKMGKGPFPHVGHFVQGCSMIFQLAFVCETGSPDCATEHTGHKNHVSLAVFQPKRDLLWKKSLLTQLVDGIKEIDSGQVKFVRDLQRHVSFHRKIFIPGKSDENGSSLWGLKGHVLNFNPRRKKAILGSYCRVASGNPMLIYFQTNQWFWCTCSWKREQWVTFLLFGSKQQAQHRWNQWHFHLCEPSWNVSLFIPNYIKTKMQEKKMVFHKRAE